MHDIVLGITYRFDSLDLVPYIIFISILLITSTLRISVKLRMVYLAIELLLFTGLRYDIGSDYPAYKEAILGYNDHEYDRFELFDQFIVDITRVLGNYQFFFFFTALLTYIPLVYFCYKQSRDSILSFFIYIFYPYMFFESMSAIRNFIAISFVMFALMSMIQKNTWKALFFIAVAFGFHKTALAAFLIIPLYKLKLKYSLVLCVWLASFGCSVLIEDFFSSLNTEVRYIQLLLNSVSMEWSGGKTMTYLVNFVGLVIIINWNRIKSLKSDNNGLLNVFIFGIVIWNLFAFDFVTRARISMLFLVSMLLLFPELEYINIKYKRKVRRIVFLFFFSVFVSSFVINIKGNLEKGIKISYLPYQTIFSHVDYERDTFTFGN